jgi:hypothetical protein
VTGEQWLEVNGLDSIHISEHSFHRVRSITQRAIDAKEMLGEFKRARHVKVDRVFALGYRPQYRGRKQRGEGSWYFLSEVMGQELMFVVGQQEDGRMALVTIYLPSRQTQILRSHGGA